MTVVLAPSITTGRLELRRWSVDDLDELMSAIAVSIDELGHWLPWAMTTGNSSTFTFDKAVCQSALCF